MGAEDQAIHIPHLHTRNLINRKTRDGDASQVKRKWIEGSSRISRTVHIFEEDSIARREEGDGLFLKSMDKRKDTKEVKGARRTHGRSKGNRSSVPYSTKEIKSFNRLVKGTNVLEIARNDDPSSVFSISTMENCNVIIFEIQPGFETVAQPEQTLQ